MKVVKDFDGWYDRGGQARYPWDEWLDGEVREARRGEDFECSPQALQSAIQNASYSRRHRVRTRIIDQSTVVFQALLDQPYERPKK